MKSEGRAWIVTGLLFFLWRTLPASPFRYFADMIGDGCVWATGRLPLPPLGQALLIYFLMGLLLVTFLLISRSRSRLYLAGLCALAEMAHHLVLCIRTGQIYDVSPAIAIGLALALLFLLVKAKSPALWLSDAYILSLGVWLLYDGVLPPLLKALSLEQSGLAALVQLPADPWINRLSGLWHLPLPVWAILPLALAVVPVILLGRGRQKG